MPKYLIEYRIPAGQGKDAQVVFSAVLDAPEEVTAQAVGRQIGPQVGPDGEDWDYVDTCDRVDSSPLVPEYRVTVPSYNRDGVPIAMHVTTVSTGETQVLRYPDY